LKTPLKGFSDSRLRTLFNVTSADGNPQTLPVGETHKKSKGGAIAGGVIGGLIGMGAIGLLAFFFLRRRTREQQTEITESTNNGPVHQLAVEFSDNSSGDLKKFHDRNSQQLDSIPVYEVQGDQPPYATVESTEIIKREQESKSTNVTLVELP
jgi:hypothetical protein